MDRLVKSIENQSLTVGHIANYDSAHLPVPLDKMVYSRVQEKFGDLFQGFYAWEYGNDYTYKAWQPTRHGIWKHGVEGKYVSRDEAKPENW